VPASRLWSRWATGDGHRLASARLRPVLGEEVAAGRSTAARAQLVNLIEQMTRENPFWSRRRIASELAKLGHAIDKDTVAQIRSAFHPERTHSRRPIRPFLRSPTLGRQTRLHLLHT
jgi:hypothetical protein